MSEIYVGIDLGGTNIKLGAFDQNLKLLRKSTLATKANLGPDAVIERIQHAANQILTEINLNLDNISAVGIGAIGPANYKKGIIIKAANLPKFDNFPISQTLSRKLNKPVVFENDANTACWGEFVCGAGKDITDMVFFTLGTGIGGAIVTNGKLLRGYDGNAAELGHIIIHPNGRLCGCGQKGCVEAYASASSTAERATEAINAGTKSSLKKVLEQNGKITCKDVYQHLTSGDDLAKQITDKTAQALATICINMLYAVEPQKIVFAGGMIAAGDILLDRIKYYFNEQIWSLKKENIEICFATLGEDAGIIGAAALARQSSNHTDS